MFYGQREEELVQFKPARAKKKLDTIEDLTPEQAATTYDEQKIDGERYLIQTGRPLKDGRFMHGVTSRRESATTGRFVEKTDRVPHISNHSKLPHKCIFDCEFVASGDILLIDFPGRLWDKLMEPNHRHMKWIKNKFDGQLPVYPHVSHTVSIMGSLGPEAVRKQEARGKIWAYAFDIPQYLGQSTVKNGQLARRRLLARILEQCDPEDGVIMMPAWANLTRDEVVEFFYLVTDPVPVERGGNGVDGGEGLIIKGYDNPYNHAHAWCKAKADYPADVVFTGRYKVGDFGKTGKMDGMVSSLEIGVYVGDDLYPIGWVSAIMNSEAGLVRPEDLDVAGKAIEVRHNGLQKDDEAPCGYTLRHPRFRRHRDNDKSPKDCTWQALFDEVQNAKRD